MIPSRLPNLRNLLRRLRNRWRDVMRSRWVYRLPVDGAVFIVVTLLIGLAAMNTAAQLLYLVFGMMCALWVLSDFMATTSMGRLRISRHVPGTAVAGEPTEISVVIENRKRLLSSFSLRVQDFTGQGDLSGGAFFTRVLPRTTVRESYRCVFPRRGTWHLTRLTVATRFPFGLIERRINRSEDSEILVLPPTIPLGNLPAAIRAELGQSESRLKGHGSGLYGIRQYTEGESARGIHWKLSARTSDLMLREFESDQRRRATILVDNRLGSAAGSAEREALERAIVLAGSLAAWLLGRGYEVELATSSGRVPFGLGSAHQTRILRALALLEPASSASPSPVIHSQDPHSIRMMIVQGERTADAGDCISVPTSAWEAPLGRALAPVPMPMEQTGPTLDAVRERGGQAVWREGAT